MATITETAAERLTDDDLLEHYEAAKSAVENYKTMAGKIEQEIYRRMEERNATAIPSGIFTCELQTKNEYDQVGFTALKEIFNDADLAECVDLAHEETTQVPDKWRTQKVLALAKRYGDHAQSVVDRARSESRPKLKFDLFVKTPRQPGARWG